MSKVNKILLVVVIILLIALAGVLYWQKGGFGKPYYAVYLNTGDIYFGKISKFPRFHLNDVYFLQRNASDQQNPLSLAKFSNAFWGPEDEIYINDEMIVWKAELSENSQLVNYFKNPQSQNQQPTGQLPNQAATSTKK